MAQHTEPLSVVLAFFMGTSSKICSLISIQLVANGLEEAAKDGPKVWFPANQVGDLDEAPHSWMRPGATRGMKQQVEDLSLLLVLTAFQIGASEFTIWLCSRFL